LAVVLQLLSKLVFPNDLFNLKAPYVQRKVELALSVPWAQLLGQGVGRHNRLLTREILTDIGGRLASELISFR
jgi:hypothetical protein